MLAKTWEEVLLKLKVKPLFDSSCITCGRWEMFLSKTTWLSLLLLGHTVQSIKTSFNSVKLRIQTNISLFTRSFICLLFAWISPTIPFAFLKAFPRVPRGPEIILLLLGLS